MQQKQINESFRICGLIAAGFPLLFLSACGGGVRSEYASSVIVLPPHIKSIAIAPFQNETSHPLTGNKLWLAVREKFVRDGRVAYVDDEGKADAVIVGTIKHFHETVLVHDVNFIPQEYQLWVIMEVKLLDKANNQYLWEEALLEQKMKFLTETQPGGKTGEEAREQLWDRYATDIVRRTLDGFGSVTSVSPRSVPQHDEKLDEGSGKLH